MRWLHGAQGSNSLMTVPPGQTFLCAPGHAPYTATTTPSPLRQYHLPRSTRGQLPSEPIRPRRTSQDHLRPIDWCQLEPPGTIPHESKPTFDEWLSAPEAAGEAGLKQHTFSVATQLIQIPRLLKNQISAPLHRRPATPAPT